MTSLIIDIQSMPLWFSIPLGIVYLAALAYFIYTLWHYRRKNNIILLLFTIASLASGQSAWAAEKTVTYTLDGTWGENYVVNLTATASGDATGTYGTSWNFQTDFTASVTLANGIKLSFGSNKSGNAMAWQDDCLRIESLAGTTNGAYVSLSHDGYYIYHITLKDYNDNLITEAWTTEKSYTYRASFIRLKTIVVEYDNYIPFTGAVITGINNVYAVSTEAVAPAPTVTWHGTTLTKGTHYTLSYQNNEAPGTATITVTSKGIFYKGASISKNYTLRWAQYTVRFHKNDGGNPDATTDQSFTYTEQKALTANAFTREDYLFEGWNTQADGNGTAYTDGQSVQNLSATDGAVVHLYAQWRQGGGSCGDNAHWSYDDNGTLSITGTGGTSDFSVGNRPWEQYKDAITTLYIGDGITYIGEDAFTTCRNLATITGGNDLTDVKALAFKNTPWYNAAISKTTAVTYLGHVAYCGTNVTKSNVTIQEGTVRIAKYAFVMNPHIDYVTIPATVTSIDDFAFYDCIGLWEVNVLGSTPPTLGDNVFYLNSSHSRTFNVRSADYKTADGWADIFNNTGEYQDYDNFQIRVVSTLALPDGVNASADDTEKVTIDGTDYYAENAEITLSGLGAEHTTGDITYRSRATINYDNVDANAGGQATFTMPAADATVTVADFPYAVKYIDEDGTKQTCEHPTVIESSNNSQTLNNSDGWYVVLPGEVTISGQLYFENSDAYLILCDGATLTVSDNFNAIQAKDITIYGQTQGSGTVNAIGDLCGIDAHDININGGTVNATSGAYGFKAEILNINGGIINATGNIYGINAGRIILGWTNPTDHIYANSYYVSGTINVNFGQTFWNGTEILSGTLYYYNGGEPTGDLTKLNGKTLEPCNTIPFIIDGTAILLDDDSAQPDGYKNADRIAALADGQPHDIMLLGRTLYRDGDWNTLCLPFTVDGHNNSANKLFYNAAIMKFDYSYWYDTNGKIFDTNTDGSHRSGEVENGSLYLNFNFGENNYIEAGRPYIVKWPDTELDNVEDPVFQGVTVTRTTPSYYTTEEGRDPQTGLGNVTFRGTYSPIDYTEDNHSILFLGTNNTLYYPEAGAHIGAFRCYFELGNGLTAGEPNSAVRGFNLNFDEQGTQTTGIIGHTEILRPDGSKRPEVERTDNTDKADAAWYSLDGVKLDSKPTQKGLYFHGGRKVVIK